MQNIYEILARAAALRDETQLNSISPERAGGIMYDTLLALNDLWLQQGAALVINKIYASVAAMEADTAPVSDLTGQPLRPGQIVVIASSDSDNGSVYRYNGTDSPSWSLVGEIGNLEPVDSLDSDSTQLPLAAHQGKVLDEKISQLGQSITNQSVKGNDNEWVTVLFQPTSEHLKITLSEIPPITDVTAPNILSVRMYSPISELYESIFAVSATDGFLKEYTIKLSAAQTHGDVNFKDYPIQVQLRFNKTKKIVVSLSDNKELEQGTVDSLTGLDTMYPTALFTRLRTINKISRPVNISCKSDMSILYWYRYSANDGTYVDRVELNGVKHFQYSGDAYISRFVFAKDNITQTLQASDADKIEFGVEDFSEHSNISFTDESGYIGSDGNFVAASASTKGSDYIPCANATKVVLRVPVFATSTVIQGTAFYDKNKKFIENSWVPRPVGTETGAKYVEYTVPANSAYLRTTYFSANTYGSFYCITDISETAIDKNICENIKDIYSLGLHLPIIGHPDIYLSENTGNDDKSGLSYSDVCDLYDALVTAHSPLISRGSDLGLDASETYTIRSYKISKKDVYICDSDLFDATDYFDASTMGKRTILVNAGIHGDEKVSIYGTYLAVKELLESTEDWAQYILSNFDILIIPCLNPWGLNNNSRYNSNNVDLNRQFNAETPAQEVSEMITFIGSVGNLFAILDMHNTTALIPYIVANKNYRYYLTYCKLADVLYAGLSSSLDALYSGSGKPKLFGLYRTQYEGQLHWYANKLGVLGNTLEVPRINGSVLNDSKFAKTTKEFIINAIQAYSVIK